MTSQNININNGRGTLKLDTNSYSEGKHKIQYNYGQNDKYNTSSTNSTLTISEGTRIRIDCTDTSQFYGASLYNGKVRVNSNDFKMRAYQKVAKNMIVKAVINNVSISCGTGVYIANSNFNHWLGQFEGNLEENHTGNDQNATKTTASDTISQTGYVYNVRFEIDSDGYITYTNPFGDTLRSTQPFPDNILEDMSFTMYKNRGNHIVVLESLEYIKLPD